MNTKTQSKKHIETQFICKIADMMENHSNSIRWSDDGSEVILVDVDQMCEKVLPLYFRHSNFNSFMRQLNMYSFVKTEKKGKSLTFKHQLFFKGNQSNFFLIQRRKKFRQNDNIQQRFQADCQKLLTKVKSEKQITSNVQSAIISLLEFKYVGYQNLKKIKDQISGLYYQLKDSRNKKIQDICKQLKKDTLQQINQLCLQSKKIDQYLEDELLKQPEQTKESLEPIREDQLYNRNFQSSFPIHPSFVFHQNLLKSEGSGSSNANGEKKPALNECKQNINVHPSYSSFPILIEQYRTRKEAGFQNKLYNPFNSQNSFIYMPNYLGGPSQIHYEGKTNRWQEFYQQKQKSQHFDQQVSASISFAKDLSQGDPQQQLLEQI